MSLSNVNAEMAIKSNKLETIKPLFASSPTFNGFAELVLFNSSIFDYTPKAIYRVYSNPYAKSKADDYASSLNWNNPSKTIKEEYKVYKKNTKKMGLTPLDITNWMSMREQQERQKVIYINKESVNTKYVWSGIYTFTDTNGKIIKTLIGDFYIDPNEPSDSVYRFKFQHSDQNEYLKYVKEAYSINYSGKLQQSSKLGNSIEFAFITNATLLAQSILRKESNIVSPEQYNTNEKARWNSLGGRNQEVNTTKTYYNVINLFDTFMAGENAIVASFYSSTPSANDTYKKTYQGWQKSQVRFSNGYFTPVTDKGIINILDFVYNDLQNR